MIIPYARPVYKQISYASTYFVPAGEKYFHAPAMRAARGPKPCVSERIWINMKKRTRVRLVSYLTALFFVMGGFIAQGYTQAHGYRTQLEYTYQRALADLSDDVSEINTTLNKSVYAGTPAQLTQLSSKLVRDCDAAKSSLSQLPVSAFNLDGTNKFIAQAGEYAQSLTRKLSASQDITDAEKQSLQKLCDYAQTVADKINSMRNGIDMSGMNIGEVFAVIEQEGDAVDDTPGITDGFQEMEDDMEGYPTLIYDGPFSDHLMEREPLLTKDADEVSREDARKKAAVALNVAPSALTDAPDEAGKMPSYCFRYGDVNISVTTRGNLISYMLNPRGVEDAKLSVQQAGVKAGEYLRMLSIENMVQSYYDTVDNICVFNFAYEQDGVICYPDLIKVGIALDNGEAVSFESRGFIANHREDREIPTPAISEAEAMAIVSKLLTPGSAQLAVIPTGGDNEVFTYEVRCKSDKGQNVLVYINAMTGAEEQILLLIETDTGVLTM